MRSAVNAVTTAGCTLTNSGNLQINQGYDDSKPYMILQPSLVEHIWEAPVPSLSPISSIHKCQILPESTQVICKICDKRWGEKTSTALEKKIPRKLYLLLAYNPPDVADVTVRESPYGNMS